MQRDMLAEQEQRFARRTVATYVAYTEAQRAVDYLSDQKFPVERVAIVAEGLKFVEQVTGRQGIGKAILASALSGALTGALIGFVLGLFSLIQPLSSALSLLVYGAIIGAIIGAIMGAISHALMGGRRDFTSVSGMRADQYNVMVDDEVAGEATRLLAMMSPTTAKV